MNSHFRYLNQLINKNKSEFSNQEINWINAYNACEAQEYLSDFLESESSGLLFKKTKPYYNHISKGCQLCGAGEWSCLFVTGKCNASCFYCPTAQCSDDLPTSQSLTFSTPESYAAYVNEFAFEGVGFSGGEPFLVYSRVLAYLKELRKKCSPDLYVWMYTNGILASREKFQELKEAGLNEIRFDIGATGYSLEKVKLAKGIIDNITIEIPAIPEEKQQIMELLPSMIEAGVTNLNLHQLRLTPYNEKKIIKRPYTIIPAERPVVMESELMALEIIEFARKNYFDIGINYCSFYFKNRFQKAGFRRKVATKILGVSSLITENGFVRKIDGNKLSYIGFLLSDSKNGHDIEKSINIANQEVYISSALAMPEKVISEEVNERLNKMLLEEPKTIPTDPGIYEFWRHEYIEPGLRPY